MANSKLTRALALLISWHPRDASICPHPVGDDWHHLGGALAMCISVCICVVQSQSVRRRVVPIQYIHDSQVFTAQMHGLCHFVLHSAAPCVCTSVLSQQLS